MKIHRIRLREQDLKKLSLEDRDFLLVAGHMLNECSSLHKVFAWCQSGHALNTSPTELEGTVSNAQAMIYARLLAGKLLEGWEMLQRSWHGTKISQRIEPLLHPEALATLQRLKKYFGSTNLIHRVRHSFAFHYSASTIGASSERASKEPHFEIVLGGNIGNNFYLASEIAVNVAVFNAIEPDDLQRGMRRFLEEVQSVAHDFTTFLEGATMALMHEATNSALLHLSVEDEVLPTLRFSEVNIPHFCLADDAAKPSNTIHAGKAT